MKHILGWTLISLLPVGIFMSIVKTEGTKTALIVFGLFSLGICAVIGIYLIYY